MAYIGTKPGIGEASYRSITDFTATASQTTFNTPAYSVGYVNVYRNGVRLGAADFTASTGNTVVLGSAASDGDLVTVESFLTAPLLSGVPNTPSSVGTTLLVDQSVTPAKLSQPLTQGAAVSASGTSIDFTSIPSWVKRITVMFSGVSTNGTSIPMIQLGDSGGVETSGYLSTGSRIGSSTAASSAVTAGFGIGNVGVAAAVMDGSITISLFGSNRWVAFGGVTDSANTFTLFTSGGKTLSDTLDRIRITTVNGTDTFDAGSINILYE